MIISTLSRFQLICLFVSCLSLQLLAPSTYAQELIVESDPSEADEIETDRDSFTPATSAVGRGLTVFEASYSFIENRNAPESHSFPETIVRYGISDRLELRLGWNFEGGGSGTVSGGEVGGEDLAVEQESRVLYGGKFQTSDQEGWIPESSLIVQGYTPTTGEDDSSSIVAGQVIGWTFANGWMWNSAFRFGTGDDEGDYLNQWAPSTVLKVPVNDDMNIHAEYFGIMASHAEDNFNHHFASFGGHVLLTPNLELGVRFGFGLNEESPRFFNNVGIGWRF